MQFTEGLEDISDLFTTRHEHDDFRLKVGLDEAPQHGKLLVERADKIMLLEVAGDGCGSRGRCARDSVNTYSNRILETESSEIFH
jgi:hypothetical protein